MATERELLLGLVTKAYNVTDTEIMPHIFEQDEKGNITGIKETASEFLLSMDATRVKSWKDKETDRLNKLAAEKTAAINTAWENRLREGFSITDDLKGDDLFNKTLEVYKANATGDGKGKSSKDYLELESRYKSLENKINADYIPKSEFDTFKSGIERQQRLSFAINQAKQVKASMKLIYPEAAEVRQTMEKYFDVELAAKFDDVQILDNGAIVPLKNGQRIENQHNNPVDFSEIVKETALKFYAEEKQGATGNGGQQNNGGGGAATTDIEKLKAIVANPNASAQDKWNARKQIAALELKQ